MRTWSDVSYLFSNFKNTGINTINFSDYNSIKSGSYGKPLKAYYKSESDPVKNTSKPNRKDTVKKDVDKTGLSKIKAESDELKKSVEALSDSKLWKTTNGAYDMDKIAKAVKDFASEYNDVVEQNSKVNNRDVNQYASWMKSMTNTMSNSLSKVGVTVGTDGKLSVDEEALKKADSKNLKALFSGNTSYVAQISDKASSISSAALRNNSLYSSSGSISPSLQGMFSDWI